VNPRIYSLIFALLAGGFIAASQVNVILLHRSSSETLFLWFLIGQVVFGGLFLAGTWAGVLGLGGTLIVMLGFMACVGITNPNASALAIGPFTKNAGSASALLGFFQLGTGAVISTLISAATPDDRLPIVAIFGVTAAIGLAILFAGRKGAQASAMEEVPVPIVEPKRDFAKNGSHATTEGEACRM
jgi:DHA1 family bicyclomycin/chloramphenicol resistance-like MFS transporter